MPELLGRLPVKIEMSNLTQKEYVQILNEIEFNLIK